MRKLLFTYCLIFCFIVTMIGQNNPCGCIHLHTPKLEQAVMFFPADTIKKENFQSAVVTYYQSDTFENDMFETSKTGMEQKQIFLFDKNGYIRSEQNFTNPRFPSQTDFKRNTAHQVIQKTTFFLDTLGNPRANVPKSIVDISYPDQWTTKTKKRDFRGDILQDSISSYVILKKDKLNRWQSMYYLLIFTEHAI